MVNHGKKVLLGTRVERLPNEEDLSHYREEFRPFATLEAMMPVERDIVTIEGLDGEWRVDRAGANRDHGWNFWICELHPIKGSTYIERDSSRSYMRLRIVYIEEALLDESNLSPSSQQALWSDVQIVGQTMTVSTTIRVPALDEDLVIVETKGGQ